MVKLTIGGRTVTVDDSFRSLPADQQQAAVEEIAASLGMGASAPQGQEMAGFGSRANREQDMPETPDLKRELAVSKEMARHRSGSSAQQEDPILRHVPDFLNPTATSGKDIFLQDYTFGLADEAKALGAGVGNWLSGNSFGEGYDVAKEADRRLREEYAAKNPKTAAAAGIAGLLTGGMGKAAEGAAAAAIPQTLGQSVKEGATVGAIQGGIYGAAEGDQSEDGRLLGGVKGALTGGAFGAAAPIAVAGVKAVASPVVNTVRSIVNPEREAARRVASAHARDLGKVGTLDDAAYDAAKAAGQPVTLMERGGGTTRALARSAANQSPEARALMEDVVRPRFATQVERLDDVLRSESKLGATADDFIALAEAAARKANGPAYKKAMSLGAGNIWDGTLERLTSAPAMQKAMKGAIAKAADNAVIDGFGAMNPRVGLDDAGNLLFRSKGGLPSYPDLRLWDLTKRELDRLGNMAARNGDSDARIYRTLAKSLTEHLDSMGEMGAAYKAARQTAASFFGAQNAYEAGTKFAVAKGAKARDAVKGLSKLSSEERELFREGYIRAMRDQLGELKSNRDATLAVMNSAGDLARARVALGKEGAQRLQAQLEIEATMDAVRKEFGNSTTARQLAEMGLASAAGSGAMAASGNTDPTSLTVGALAGAATKWGRGKIDAKLATQIGKLLVSNDPKKVEALAKMASRSPQILQLVRAIRANLVSAGTIAVREQAAP